MLDLWLRAIHFKPMQLPSLAGTYEVLSSASVDDLWSKMVNLAGLIYQAVSRLFPIPIKIFVERVLPREMLTVRVLALPGLEERVTYRIESTVCGTYVSYSVTLRGWLSPLVWSIIRPYAAKVASELAHAAEQAQALPEAPNSPKSRQRPSLDWLGVVILTIGIGKSLGDTAFWLRLS
jgi:hypothetical protein